MRKAVRGIVFKDNSILVMKRNKFGHEYYTLPGGGIRMGETVERTLVREMSEETSVRLGDARLVFIEDAGAPYGIQYIYLIDYISGQPKLSPDSGEASLNKLGQNLHEPMWMPMKDLLDAPFVSERLKQVIMHAIKSGFPAKAETI